MKRTSLFTRGKQTITRTVMADNKKPAYFRLMKLREEKEAAKRKPTSGLKGTKLDRERGDASKSLDPESLTASERKAAGRTKQSRRGTVKVEKARPAYTEVERTPTTTAAHEERHNKKNTSTAAHEKRHRSMKAGGRVRMDGTAKPR
jgi:hypothetical protein